MTGVFGPNHRSKRVAWPLLVMFAVMSICPMPFCHSHDEIARNGNWQSPLETHLKVFHTNRFDAANTPRPPEDRCTTFLNGNCDECGWHIHWILPTVVATFGGVTIDGSSESAHGICDCDFLRSSDNMNASLLTHPSSHFCWDTRFEIQSTGALIDGDKWSPSFQNRGLSLSHLYCNIRC